MTQLISLLIKYILQYAVIPSGLVWEMEDGSGWKGFLGNDFDL
jgi:hypothetical protein